MKPERWNQIDALFARALEVPPHERDAFLDRGCAGDRSLLDAVVRLLAADERARTFLELPAPLAAGADAGADAGAELPSPPGTHLGPYRIDRLLGHGGMGAVYLATRDDGQFERQVALKLLRAGRGARNTGRCSASAPSARSWPASSTPIARLLRRRRRPTAARPSWSWSTSRGSRSTTTATAAAWRSTTASSLPPPARRGPLRPPQPARPPRHQAGEHPGHRGGEPKLLDFGIAKLLAPAPARRGAEAGGVRLMTPAYASPEQVRGERDHAPRATSIRWAWCSTSCCAATARTISGAQRPTSWRRPSSPRSRRGPARCPSARSPRPAAPVPASCGASCAATSTPSCSPRCARSRSAATARRTRWPPTSTATCGPSPSPPGRTPLYIAGKLVRRHPIGSALAGPGPEPHRCALPRSAGPARPRRARAGQGALGHGLPGGSFRAGRSLP